MCLNFTDIIISKQLSINRFLNLDGVYTHPTKLAATIRSRSSSPNDGSGNVSDASNEYGFLESCPNARAIPKVPRNDASELHARRQGVA